jgi:hypothetical protein
MPATSTKRQVDPDDRRLMIGMSIIGLVIVVAVMLIGPRDGIKNLFGSTTDNTQNVQVCPNAQPPLTKEAWYLSDYGYPPDPGIYKVTYFKDAPKEIDGITWVSTDTSSCS